MQSKFKMVCFDMDGTLIKGTTANIFFAKLLGVEEQMCGLESQFKAGKIDSEMFMHLSLDIMRKLSNKIVKDNFYAMPLINHIDETISKLKSYKVITNIVTTSNVMFAKEFQNVFGFDYVYGTQFEVTKYGKIKKGISACEKEYKSRFVKELSNSFNISMDEVVAIGDSMTDIPLFNEVGLSIALNYDKSLDGMANIYLRSESLLSILPHIIDNYS